MALPFGVLDSMAYRNLPHPARSLLLEVARQVQPDRNGQALLSGNYLAARGWKSSDVIIKAKRELIDAELIFETVKGARPNRAGWYAVTWRDLDPHPAYDPGTMKAFIRGRYRLKEPIARGDALTPSNGAGTTPIAPPHGVGTTPATPRDGAIRPHFDPSPTPSDGDHLDVAISGAPLDHCTPLSDLDRWCSEGGASCP